VVKQGRYNVGAGESHEIGQLLNRLVAHSRVPITVEVDPARLPPVDVPDVVCDNQRLRQATGWQPRIPLDTTLSDMLDHWRQAIKES
jgi:GDP-4-dehydro-6-deoxy-D-mannose reductase